MVMELKEGALDRTLCRTCLVRGYGHVLRQNVELYTGR